MQHSPGPRVFISATSGDLGSVRQLVKDALLAIDCHPVEQTPFPPDYRKVSDMLEDKIQSCEAVIHIAGCHYGAEPDPSKLPPDTPRRSYTQMEYDLARKLGKKLYVFICPEKFPYDTCDPETEDKQRLQQVHREAILEDDKLFTEIEEKNQIATKVRELQLELQRLRRRIGRYATGIGVGIAVLVLVLVGIGYGVWQQKQQLGQVASAVIDPAQMAERLRRSILTKAEQRLQVLRDKGADWQDIRQLERQREAALGQVGDLVRFIEQGLAGDADPVFREASRILSQEGPDDALAYLDSHRQDLLARVDRLATEEQTARTRKRQALEPLLLEAQLQAGNLDWDKALASYRTVVAKAPEWSHAHRQLGDLLFDLGRYGEAEKHLQDAIDRTQDDDAWAIAANSLAELYRQTSLWEKAESLLRRALAIEEKDYGANHTNVSAIINNLALLFQDTNRLSKAEPLFRRALAIDEKAYGPDHPEVAIRLNNLASLLYVTNHLTEANPLYRRALAINEKAYGADHPNVATNLNNLALLLQATNRPTEAGPLFIRALAINEKAYGPDHPKVASALNNLATLFIDTNRLAEAEPLLIRALSIDEKAYGPDHPNIATDLNNLSSVLQDSNRLTEAEPLYRRALTINEKAYGPDHPNVATNLNNLAWLLQDTNRLIEAEPLFLRALDIDERAYGPDHPKVATDLNSLARLFYATNRPTEAEPLMRRTLIILHEFERKTGYEHPHMQTALRNYRGLLKTMGLPAEEVEQRVKQALAVSGPLKPIAPTLEPLPGPQTGQMNTNPIHKKRSLK